jgi:hypothetical protein
MRPSPRRPARVWKAWLAALVLVCGCTLATSRAEGPKDAAPVDYNREIRPILSKNCYSCHGQDATHREAGLRLDRRDDAVKELKSGAVAIVPGSVDESDLIARVIEPDETLRMPPRKSGDRLSAAEIDRLRRWVEQGAPYAEHWALIKPEARPLPAVKDRAWPRNGLDYWVLARLEKEGLKPSPEADRFTLLRRASLDLRGLPPSPRECDVFAADNSENAYEKAVDRFLEDPAYGERWARLWLDLARYADSAGYGSDPLRTIWRYRDWVINAYNTNQPYDKFTIEQIAGDLLSDATTEQKMATAFHRNTMTNTEGGTDDEEFRVAAIKDRVDTTWQVWMGLTLGCAKCHSHKYDPFTQDEYYKFYAFFNQTADNDQPDERPVLAAPTPAQREQMKKTDARIAALKTQLDTPTPALAEAQVKWEADRTGPSEWVALEPAAVKADSSAAIETQPDGSLRIKPGPGTPEREVYTVKVKPTPALKGVTAFRLEAIPDPALPGGGSGRASDGNFVLSRFTAQVDPSDGSSPASTGRFVRVELPGDGKMLSLAEVQVLSGGENVARKGEASQSSTDFDGEAPRAIDGNTDGDYYGANSTTHTRAEANPWWEVKLSDARAVERITLWNRTDGGTGTRLVNFRVLVLDNARKVVWQTDVSDPPAPKRDLAPPGRLPLTFARAVADFTQDGFDVAAVLATSTAKANAKGWAVGPKQKAPHAAVFLLKEPLATGENDTLTFRLEHAYKDPGYALGRFRLSSTSDPKSTRRADVPEIVLTALDVPADRRSPEQRETLARHYRGVAPALQPVRDEVARLEKMRPETPTVPVMVDLPADKRRVTRLLEKGNFLTPGKAVEPGVPASLHPFPKDAPGNRLAMARWLVDPANPVTARVAVNRYWSQLFGTGLVETEEDFGTQGDVPSHPELLDWLAVEYMKIGWDTKAILRRIVTSATYRQSSKVTPEQVEKDPRNRFLGRGPRFRLDAETVRDQALALSGLLSRKMYGPSVFPPQPAGLWQAAFNGQRTWSTSAGEDRHRRALYTFWRRTVPYPSMATFDAPSREICSVRRIRTNTPLQAFVTLNDPVYVEASQALARRIVTEGGASIEDRVRFALRLALSRPPAAEQVDGLATLYRSERAHYATDRAAAVALATEPLGPLPGGMDPAELAAWTTVANVLLNLDGVLTKG